MRQFLNMEEVLRRTGLGRSTIYDQMDQGEFPRSYQLTRRRVGWKEEEVEAWIESRTAVAVKFSAHRGRQVVRCTDSESRGDQD
jgi:prophage regulatory protein